MKNASDKDKATPLSGTGTRSETSAPEKDKDRTAPQTGRRAPKDSSGRQSHKTPGRGPGSDTLEIATEVADEEGLTAPDTEDTKIPERKP